MAGNENMADRKSKVGCGDGEFWTTGGYIRGCRVTEQSSFLCGPC